MIERLLESRPQEKAVAMAERSPTLDALIRMAEAAAQEETDRLSVFVRILKQMIRTEIDPYLLNGVLIEGIASTVLQRIPAEKQGEAAAEVIQLLRDRFGAQGTL